MQLSAHLSSAGFTVRAVKSLTQSAKHSSDSLLYDSRKSENWDGGGAGDSSWIRGYVYTMICYRDVMMNGIGVYRTVLIWSLSRFSMGTPALIVGP